MNLEGTFRQFPLREILEMMVDSSVTGALEVTSAEGSGYVYTHMGDLYHATFNEEQGSHAVWSMFEQLDGNFRFIAGERVDVRSLMYDLGTLMNEAEERAEAWAPLRKSIGSLRLVPVFEPGTEQEHIQINEDDWPVLAAIDGSRSIAEISAHIQRDALDVSRALVRLLDRGLVRLTQGEQTRQGGLLKALGGLRAEQPAASAQPQGGGLLARTLATIAEQATTPIERRDHVAPRPAAGPAMHTPVAMHEEQDDIVRLLRGG